MSKNNSIVYMYLIDIIHSYVDGDACCLHFLVIVQKRAVYICAQE